jgi:hypothetical protein
MGKRSLMIAVLAFALLLLASSVCLAAEQAIEKPAKLTVQIDLTDAKFFWSYPYVTTDGKIRKPAAVNLEWNIGTSSKVMKQTVIVPDNNRGEYSIVTEKGAIVNLQVTVVDAGNVLLGGGSLQIKNSGQREFFYVGLPDSTSPVVTHEAGRPQ